MSKKQLGISGKKKHAIVNHRDIYSLKKIDNIFISIAAKYGDPPNWKLEPGFVSLAKIILGQQLSLASAEAHFKKLSSYLSEFTPRTILKLNDNEMRECQISRQKATYLRILSSALIEKRIVLDNFGNQETDEIRKKLINIKGIGQWTADIYLMFCLQEKDIFPSGDIAVINTVKELFSVKTYEEIISLSEKWKPFRSLAAYYFWHYYLRKRNRPSIL
ncbi:MAG: hypothetical protein OQJ93_02835 [Ignavibacteriaceae bacterium]|jgi:DNA-3-methyladenine glycosylase II|nr:hypothetical protein [Ignavibacteriaceae bacterium]MCW8814062.1 hypothetical protein [Chlorobium sp.]MCW8817681.1 hypothetical protein [Ignavibacteriaceae bacterium]MCW8822610.1 hypothetical protein [Ignavibacteriaceae bacterium]MCW9094343.1 hypothetical protein [Ignavibacteriaceae bacterium]